MRAFEFLTEAKKVGREFNHLEDMVFTNPDDGAKRAVSILKSMEQDASDVAIIAAVATPLLFLKDKNIGLNG